MAEKIYGQLLQFELVYPLHRSACQWLGLYSPMLFNAPGVQDENTIENGDRIELQNETRILFIVCGQTAREVWA